MRGPFFGLNGGVLKVFFALMRDRFKRELLTVVFQIFQCYHQHRYYKGQVLEKADVSS